MRATIATAVVVATMGWTSVSQAQTREPAGRAEARAQLAVLAVLMFRGDVARGEIAIDRCTATRHGGAATMLRLPAAIPGVRVIGREPGTNECVVPVDSSGRRVLSVDVLEAKVVRDSIYGSERPTVEVVTTTHDGDQRWELYVLVESSRNPTGPPWVVQEFKVLGGMTHDRAGPIP